MYITKQPNGKFRAFERYKSTDGRTHTASVTMDRNTPQSRAQARRALEQIVSTKSLVKTEITFSGLVNAYIDDQKRTVKKTTWRRNEATLKRLVRIIGDVNVNNLTAGHIRTALLKYTQNPGTLNEYISRLKTAIRWAYQNDYIKSTICIDKLRRFKDSTEREKIADKYLEKNELAAVIEAASPFYANVIRFMALSGLRIGEAIALLDKDVTSVIHVHRTYDPIGNEVTSPKTLDSIRDVHIQKELADVVKAIRHDSRQYKLQTGSRSQLFIVNPFGEHLSYFKFNRVFSQITEKVIGRKLTTHALRHTHASLLAEAGVPLETISRRLGHSDSKITKEIYMHVTKSMRDRDAELLDSVALL